MGTTLHENIAHYKSGNINAFNSILEQMEPLIKHYAAKSFFMEYEDAIQEYNLAIFEGVQKIQFYSTEGQCLTYIKSCVKNRFYHLSQDFYNKQLNTEPLEKDFPVSTSVTEYESLEYRIDFIRYIQHLSSVPHNKKVIATMFLLENMSDSAIAEKLMLSRQYVHRIRRQILQDLQKMYKL